MSRDGVMQLKEIIVTFCKWGGSSKGVRALESNAAFQSFKASNPQLQLHVVPRHGKHPFVKGIFASGREKMYCVKNESPVEILSHFNSLRSESGDKSRTLNKRVVSERTSIQGYWNPYLDLSNKLLDRPSPPSTSPPPLSSPSSSSSSPDASKQTTQKAKVPAGTPTPISSSAKLNLKQPRGVPPEVQANKQEPANK